MKILVTGSAGLVGSACVDLFDDFNSEPIDHATLGHPLYDVIGIDANMRAQFFGTKNKYSGLSVDIRDQEAVEKLFAEHRFDAVIHTAGQPSHDYATDHVLEDFDINARGTLILLEATRKYCPQATFVYVSSDKVYGENMYRDLEELPTRYHSDYPFNENEGLDFAGDRSLFGCSKIAADLYVQEYGARFGMKTVCFRPGCITGQNHEGSEQHGFLAYLAKCIKEGKTYRVFGFKGKQVRDQIHARDLASAFWHFIQNPTVGAVYNMGGGPSRSASVLEAMSLIEQEMGKKCVFTIEEGRKGDRQWDVHDVSKFRKDYPEWEYAFSLKDIVKDVCSK